MPWRWMTYTGNRTSSGNCRLWRRGRHDPPGASRSRRRSRGACWAPRSSASRRWRCGWRALAWTRLPIRAGGPLGNRASRHRALKPNSVVPADWLGVADDLARRGRFGEAIHLLLLGVLGTLRTDAPTSRATTAREIARTTVGPHRERLQDVGSGIGTGTLRRSIRHASGVRGLSTGCGRKWIAQLRRATHRTRSGAAKMSADQDRILNPRTAALLILIGGAALCATIVLMVVVDPADRVVTRPSSYSSSAIGHAALAGLLREAGYRVEVNRSRQGRGVATEDLLLVLEPDLVIYAVADMQRLLAGKRRVLVALPKWRQRATGHAHGAASRMDRRRGARVDGLGRQGCPRPPGRVHHR